MKIIIDMQGAQTEFSRHRGVGRYTIGLVKALLKKHNEHEFVLALNGSFSDSVDFIRAEFEKLIDQKNICIWQQYYDCTANNPSLQTNRKIGEVTREIFLNSLNGDIIFSTNLQEGLLENAVTSVNSTPKQAYFCSTLHDVTPIIYKEYYLADAINSKWYYEKIEAALKSDIIITDSNYSKEQIINLLGAPEEKVHVVYLATDTAVFKPLNMTEKTKELLFKKIGIKHNFLIYAGGADFHKNLDRLYEAYSLLSPTLRKDHQLVMIGREIQREKQFHTQKLKKFGVENEVIFAGYVNDEDLALLYNCCSAFVFPSIEEGFGLPPLEAMACGAAVIGSNAASIPEVIGFKDALFDPFNIKDMSLKIQRVLTDSSFRDTLIHHGTSQAKKFSWQNSADQLLFILENFTNTNETHIKHQSSQELIERCMDEFVKIDEYKDIPAADILKIAQSLADSFASSSAPKLLLDMSSVININDRTGIQRVALSVCKHLLLMDLDVIVIPVYTSLHDHEFYAATSIIDVMDNSLELSQNEHIEFNNGDILIFLDLHPSVAISHTKKIKHLRNKGVFVYHVVYDLLPVQFPEYFWPELCQEFDEWLRATSKSDGVLCISQTVASEYENWYKRNMSSSRRKFSIDWFHLGADIKNAFSSKESEQKNLVCVEQLKDGISFLMVGTIEPRKGHEQILTTFEGLWAIGLNLNLLIIGKKGWKVDALVQKIKHHPRLNKQLFWLEGISDNDLNLVYENSSALINASFGEGFGLPLIEAAQYKIPIIARDIPVFKEVADTHAFYFPNSNDPEILASAIKNWISLYKANKHPKSDTMKFLSWEESSKQLVNLVLKEKAKVNI
ncbi:MAG: glycosyltransferase family 1 protein [Thiovulaceae bacterium]|nr:glycosyltransferase family 1 protein [Sulfurimonadaceae bacterium]